MTPTPAWPLMPGVPAAGHVTTAGHWHAGPIHTCPECGEEE